MKVIKADMPVVGRTFLLLFETGRYVLRKFQGAEQATQWWTGGNNNNLSKLLNIKPNAQLSYAKPWKTKRELQLDVREEKNQQRHLKRRFNIFRPGR